VYHRAQLIVPFDEELYLEECVQKEKAKPILAIIFFVFLNGV
jgi:hypothetical protein